MLLTLFYVSIAVTLLVILIKIWVKFKTGRYKITKNLTGRNFLITGASSGVGLGTAKEIAAAGGTVYLLCRDLVKTEKVADEIRKQTGNEKVYIEELNLCSFKSIRRFATRFLATNQPIHVLINNAGIFPDRQRFTEDGLDETMQANHFGHFLLTNLLLERIKESAPSRIINVASNAHVGLVNDFNMADLNFKQTPFSMFKVYAWSKLCNVLFTAHLSKLLTGTDVTVNCLCPGAVKTNILNTQPFYMWPLFVLFLPFLKTCEEGAETSLYLAISDEVRYVSGHYFSECKPAVRHLKSMDDNLAEELWRESELVTRSK